MEAVRNLEKTMAEWYKGLPHLPKDLRKWLGDNLWWITTVGIVLSVFAVFAAISALLLIFGLAGATAGLAPYGYGGTVAAGIGAAWLWSLLAIASSVITILLMLAAVNPLKVKAKKGWTLLFVVLLVNVAFNLLQALGSFNVAGLFFALLWGAVEGYFLFEIRGEFGKAAAKAEPAKKA